MAIIVIAFRKKAQQETESRHIQYNMADRSARVSSLVSKQISSLAHQNKLVNLSVRICEEFGMKLLLIWERPRVWWRNENKEMSVRP